MNNKLFLLVVLTLFAGALFVLALPEGTDTLTPQNSTSRTATTRSNISALAGNITQLSVTGSSASQSWAGFYGNVTGTIALDTSDGSRLYSWTVANPKGEVYATEYTGVPQWGSPSQTTNITCWNYTKGDTTVFLHYGELEGWDTDFDTATATVSAAGMKQGAVDSVNNTFLRTAARSFPSFYSGTAYINGTLNNDECPSLALYNSTTASTYGGSGDLEPTAALGSVAGGNYQEVLLYDNTNHALLFTAIVDFERDTPGFDGNIWDFAMIVTEKGSAGDTSTTEYNFFVELE